MSPIVRNILSIMLGTLATLALAAIPLAVLIDTLVIPGGTLAFNQLQVLNGALGLFLICWLVARILNVPWQIRSEVLVCMLLIATPLFDRGFSFLNLPNYFAELSVLALFGFLIWNQKNWALLVILIVAMLALLYTFFDLASGRVLHSDDHATFLYRLEMLKQNFPHIPFYNPQWNAGIDERFFFATGTLNIFLILSPLIYLTDLWQHYNVVPAFILYLLMPFCSYVAARLLGLPVRAAALAGLLAMTSSIAWFNWALHYGPLGFLTTTCLVPLLAALCARALNPDIKLSFLESLALILCATLLLLWSPGGIIFLPALLLGLLKVNLLWEKPKLIFVSIMLLIINLPWIFVFWSASNVSGFLAKEEGIRKISYQQPSDVAATQEKVDYQESASAKIIAKAKIFGNRSLTLFQRHANGTNALLLIFALPAMFAFRGRQQLLYVLIAGWLFLLGAVIAPFKPQLELDRMLIVLFVFLAVPVAQLLETSIMQSKVMQGKVFITRICFAICFAFIGLYGLASASVLFGKTHVPIHFRSPLAENLAQAIDTHTPSGRALFAGFILHELDGGHVAPLALKTKVPLLASSPMHQYWQYTDIIPHEFLEDGPDGFEKYFDLMNAATVIAHDSTWRQFFLSRPDLYTQKWQERRFTIFERLAAVNNYFYSGQGEILAQNSNSVTLTVQQPSAIIKFNYFPFLTTSACDLDVEKVAENINFIKLDRCPVNQPIVIKAKPAYARIKY